VDTIIPVATLAPVIETVVPVVTEPLAPAIETVAPLIETVVPVVTEPLAPAVETVAPLIETVVPVVTEPVTPVVETVAPVVDAVLPPVTDTLAPVVEEVVPPLAPVVDPVSTALEEVVTPIAPVIQPATDGVAPIVHPAVDAVAPVIAPISDNAAPVLNPIQEATNPIVDAIAPFGSEMDEAVAPISSLGPNATETTASENGISGSVYGSSDLAPAYWEPAASRARSDISRAATGIARNELKVDLGSFRLEFVGSILFESLSNSGIGTVTAVTELLGRVAQLMPDAVQVWTASERSLQELSAAPTHLLLFMAALVLGTLYFLATAGIRARILLPWGASAFSATESESGSPFVFSDASGKRWAYFMISARLLTGALLGILFLLFLFLVGASFVKFW
jgi:hypothetical protein